MFACGCNNSVWFYSTRILQMSTADHKRGAGFPVDGTEVVAELHSASGLSLRVESKEMAVGRCVSRRH